MGGPAREDLLATVDVGWRGDPVEIVKCRDCGALVLGAVQPPSTYTETDWDWYVEQLASIETIAGILAKAGAPEGARMLDVGCGFGFGLDIGARVFGWSGIGLDPSIAADRGRAELGLDIRPGTLDAAFAPDERFDVIFASEVLEHVPDPRDFLTAVRRRLTDRGVFLMTTPDGGVVHEETSITTLFPVLSVGAHEFLVDAPGLERLLRQVGFEVATWQLGPSLGAVAALAPEALRAARPDAQADLSKVARYCDQRAAVRRRARHSSWGWPTRHPELTTHIAEYGRAKGGLERLGARSRPATGSRSIPMRSRHSPARRRCWCPSTTTSGC